MRSHVTSNMDLMSGLMGAMIITGAETSVDATGKPTDVDREFVVVYHVADENNSAYLAVRVAHLPPPPPLLPV